MTSAWPNLSDLIRVPPSLTDDSLGWFDSAADCRVGLVGAPLKIGSVTPGRCDLAPDRLRCVLKRIGRYDIESQRELQTTICDYGDISLSGLSIEDATRPIMEACAKSTAFHELTLLVGGNNAVTRPGLQALASVLGFELGDVGLITLDAHFDMRSTEYGLTNGNPVRALLEDGLPGRNIAQVGLASFANSGVMHQDALAAGNRVMTIGEVHRRGILDCIADALGHVAHCEALLVDCDIDVIDRSQFPGAPGARAGGMSALDFFAAVRRLAAEPRVRVIDLTEWDPPLDRTDLSALTAGRWLAEVLAGFENR